MTRQEKIMSIAKCEVVDVAYIAEMMFVFGESELRTRACRFVENPTAARGWLTGNYQEDNEAEVEYVQSLGFLLHEVNEILYMGGPIVNPNLARQDLGIMMNVVRGRLERWEA